MIDTTPTERLRHDLATLLDALRDAGATITNPKVIRCPFHDDQHASGSTYGGDDGVYRYKCHVPTCNAGGDVYDIRARVRGTTPTDELRAERNRNAKPTVPTKTTTPPARLYGTLPELLACVHHLTAHYEYTNPASRTPELVVMRVEVPGRPKRFIQAHQIQSGPWIMHAPPKPWPLYNRARVATTDRIVFVEGEGVVHSLHAVDIVATTTPGGAGKAEHADLTPLAGKTCILWPDADTADANGRRTGIVHMRDVAKRLEALDPPARVLWLDPDPLELGDKGDAKDFIGRLPAHLTNDQKRQAVEDVLSRAVPTGPSAEVTALVTDAITGRRRVIAWPWNQLGKLTRALAPSTVTLLVASPGATKSLMLIQAVAHWHEAGEAVAVLELEDGRGFHLRRALAQKAGEAGLTEDEWCAEHPDYAITATEQYAAYMDTLGRCVYELPSDGQPTLEAVGDWIEQQAIAGKRIIAVDPLSIAEATENQHIADQKFVARAKRIAETFGCSLILVMHPKKHAQGRETDDIAGGAAYGRLAQTVIWLEHLKHPQAATVNDSVMGLPVEAEINRLAHLTKTRIGRGQGLRVGYWFDGQNLKLTERGIVTRHVQT